MASSSLPNNTNFFGELDMEEDAIMLNEFVVDCLVDNPPEMEAMITPVSSSGSENNSTSTTIDGAPPAPPPRKRPKRLPEQCQHHIIAERQRRQTLSERFIALSVLIPGLKKLDKSSVLGAAIIHMQQLKERIKILEEQNNATKTVESFVVIKPPQTSCIVENNENNYNSSSTTTPNINNLSKRLCNDHQFPEIEARFSKNNVLIKIHCQLQKGILIKIMKELEKLQLLITSTNAIPFTNRTMDITIMTQMESDFNMRPQDVVENLRLIFNEQL